MVINSPTNSFVLFLSVQTLDKKNKPSKWQKYEKLAFKKIGIQTYQILTNDDEVCIPSLSCILLALPFSN